MGRPVPTWRRAGAGLLGLLGAGLLAFLAWPLHLPPPVAPVRVLDRGGLLVAERPVPEEARGDWIQEVPAVLERAVLAAEDHRFHRHPGVDPRAVARALVADLRAGRVVQGGSTITQQLARRLHPRSPGLLGKAGEALVALRLEVHLEKEEILREYLNRIYFGSHAWGVGAAARTYLDRPVTALSVAEAALLAALPRRPSVLDPWRNPTGARAARDRVLDRMEALGWLDAVAAELARSQPLGLREDLPWYHAPHFVRRLPDRPGTIRTTLDLGLQREVAGIVARAVPALAGRGLTQAAVVVADTRTSDVLAYVGSAAWTGPAGQVDGAVAPRSPGSALKPFAYLLALERTPGRGGLTLATALEDLPGAWPTTHGTWSPANYDGAWNGPVTARDALARSLNLPAVRVLERVGVATLHRRLRDAGLRTLDQRPDHYGLGLVLGDGEVRLDELVAAYAALGNDGLYRPLRFVADDPPPDPVQVADPRAAWLVMDALDDAGARAAAFGLDSALEPAFPLAAKTGTSTGWRDNLAVGVTPEVTVGVWTGNFDGAPMGEVSGITGAGPILRAVVEAATSGRASEFPRPAGLVRRPVCSLSGLAAGPHCPHRRDEWFLEGTAPEALCSWHREVEVHEDGALARGCPGALRRVAVAWPPPYATWAAESGRGGWPVADRSCLPPEDAGEDPVQVAAGIAWPPDGTILYLDPRDPPEQQAVRLRAALPLGTRRARWRVGGEALEETTTPPFSARWVPSPGAHELALEADGAAVDRVRVTVIGGAVE